MATALSSRSSSWVSNNNSPPHSLTHIKYGTVTASNSNGRSLKGLFELSKAHKRSSTQYIAQEMPDPADGAEAEMRGLGLVTEAWSVTAAEYKRTQGDDEEQGGVSALVLSVAR